VSRLAERNISQIERPTKRNNVAETVPEAIQLQYRIESAL